MWTRPNEAVRVQHDLVLMTCGAGHSLGGFAAATCLILCDRILTCTAFESPGLTTFYHRLAAQQGDEEYWRDRITNYLAIPNPINMCQKHLGRIIRCHCCPALVAKTSAPEQRSMSTACNTLLICAVPAHTYPGMGYIDPAAMTCFCDLYQNTGLMCTLHTLCTVDEGSMSVQGSLPTSGMQNGRHACAALHTGHCCADPELDAGCQCGLQRALPCSRHFALSTALPHA